MKSKSKQPGKRHLTGDQYVVLKREKKKENFFRLNGMTLGNLALQEKKRSTGSG